MKDVWVFGYGSLIWRPSFPFVERRRAWIAGWTRRLWQGSDDHRGVPEALGRVATLVEAEADSKVLGVAYRIAGPEVESVLAHLDHREKNGYERHEVELLEDDGRSFARGILFVAGEKNPNFLGDAPLDTIVEQVIHARGPSGPNTEYVVELARALRELGEPDPHLEEIASRLSR